MPRNAPDRWDREHEKQMQEQQQQERAAAAGRPTKPKVTMHGSWTARVSQSMANAAGAFVPTAAKHGPFGAHNDDDEDDTDAKQNEKARALKEQQTTTATVERHYFHMHEVWHCLYNRTETNHLRDPDNDKFKSEDARKRQISLFESLMETSQLELYRAVNADIDNECCARLQVRIHRSTFECPVYCAGLMHLAGCPVRLTQPMAKASIGSINLVHVEAARIIQRERRAYVRRVAKKKGLVTAKWMQGQAQKSMQIGAFEDAAKQLVSACSLEIEEREKSFRKQEKKLYDEIYALQAKLNDLQPRGQTEGTDKEP